MEAHALALSGVWIRRQNALLVRKELGIFEENRIYELYTYYVRRTCTEFAFPSNAGVGLGKSQEFRCGVGRPCSGVFSFFEKLHRKILLDIRTENIVGHT